MAFAVLLIYICYMLIEGSLSLCNFWESVFAVPCFAKKAMLFLAVKFKAAHAQSLSTHLMSLPMPLPLFAAALRRAQKEVRQQAQGFSCAFRHFLLRFSKYFLPHVSTLFNVLHSRVFAWREGGVDGTQQRCTGSKQKGTPRNCLQMNELS